LFNPGKNPFYHHAQVELFLARRGRKPVGRVASIVNANHNEFHKDKVGFFGFFECADDAEAAHGLLAAARSWLRDRGMDTMRGPMNFSTNEECALLMEGFDSCPTIMMPYNHPYYLGFMEAFGLKKARDLYAFLLTQEQIPDENKQAVLEKIRERNGIRLRTLNVKDFAGEIQRVKEVYNLAWSRNWGFVPFTEEEIDHLAGQMKKILDPDIVLFAEIGDRPIGFSMALPDINQALKKINGRLFPFGLLKLLWHSRKIDSVRVLTMGVIPQYQNKGIAAMFNVEMFRNGVRKGYVRADLSWILEDNIVTIRALQRMGGTLYKKYRIYEMGL
jgi:GNAT superfamily N-acetyltransferase